ncbi:IclR family transcriptional regulator [Allopusillimonas soli]|uniref:IclR family transcriptional regulator n=2 Tax=Allopusillimonas soli TaxID=659016 RepID=A0A853F858_9BURK|nr:IclR family transcriptional regulator [Allopusillimonas soli]TEA76342.1 IclR family transcriptional regulator [Allopusillimonas soli]
MADSSQTTIRRQGQYMGGTEHGGDRQFVNALARGLDILRCFQPGKSHLTNAELSRETGFPKPTVSRLTYTLCKLGYLEYSENLGKYGLASGVLSLGYSLLANMDVRNMARSYMQELAEYSSLSVSLGVRDRLDMIYVETCRGSSRVTLRLDVGSRIPVATTSMGKAMICGISQHERSAVLQDIQKTDPDNWPRIQRDIDEALDMYTKQGFCINQGEWQPEIHAVGVPLRTVHGDKQMALNCGGPAYLLSRSRLENDLGPRLAELVRDVESRIGLA